MRGYFQSTHNGFLNRRSHVLLLRVELDLDTTAWVATVLEDELENSYSLPNLNFFMRPESTQS